MARRIVGIVGLLATIAFAAPAAHAAFHFMSIREVFPGTTSDPNAQYVMLQMYFGGQNFVATHFVRVYDSSGGTLGTFTFPSMVDNGANQDTILIATPEAETLFGITADLTMTAVIPLSAGAVCFDAPDCVSWGNFTGNGSLLSPAGTPYSMATGLQIGHAIRRDISAGNPALLEAGDDTNDSANDFDCADTAQPINNDGDSGMYTDGDPCPPTPTPTITNTPTDTPTRTPTATPTLPTHDAVVIPPRPLLAKIGEDDLSVIKKLKVGVRNANLGAPVSIKLTASGCAGAIISTPDFDKDTAGEQDTVLVGAGKTKKALLFLEFPAAAFTSFNADSPFRCQFIFVATADVPMNSDPAPANNTVKVDVNVRDLNDADQIAAPNHESIAVSVKPLKIKIKEGQMSAAKNVKMKIGNADEDDVDHQITVSLGAGTCVGVGLPDFDDETAGVQSTINVEGGKSKTGVMALTLNRNDFTTVTAKSPARCTQQLCVTGPPLNTEPNTSNDCTELTIDVTDENDF
jgi:hypothetical protein